MDIRLFENGMRIDFRRNDRLVSVGLPSQLEGCKRGDVTRFSSASRLRLREFLLSREVKGLRRFGVTFTIPRQVDLDLALAAFRKAVHRLRTYFVRRWPDCGFVWRVELQRNKMPHLHLVAFLRLSSLSSGEFDVGHVLLLWWRSVKGLFSIPSLSDFLQFSTRCEALDGSISALRYLCDHAGKRKQAQLGYKGRQWGVVGRENFGWCDSSRVFVPRCLEAKFKRFLRRLLSFSISCPCVFGRKHITRRGNVAVTFVRDRTVRRWLLAMVKSLPMCHDLSALYEEDIPF